MNPLADSKDADIRGLWPALLRASRDARKLAEATGTPFVIVRNGKIVDGLKVRKKRTKTKKKKA